jgi:hypothetical protein
MNGASRASHLIVLARCKRVLTQGELLPSPAAEAAGEGEAEEGFVDVVAPAVAFDPEPWHVRGLSRTECSPDAFRTDAIAQ